MATQPYGQLQGVAYDTSIKELQVEFYIPSSMVQDTNGLKTMIESNCFYVEEAIWTSKLNGAIDTAVVHVQADLQDKYGNVSKNEVGFAMVSAVTAPLFNWKNLSFDAAWNNNDYDKQWMSPAITNS